MILLIRVNPFHLKINDLGETLMGYDKYDPILKTLESYTPNGKKSDK